VLFLWCSGLGVIPFAVIYFSNHLFLVLKCQKVFQKLKILLEKFFLILIFFKFRYGKPNSVDVSSDARYLIFHYYIGKRSSKTSTFRVYDTKTEYV